MGKNSCKDCSLLSISNENILRIKLTFCLKYNVLRIMFSQMVVRFGHVVSKI